MFGKKRKKQSPIQTVLLVTAADDFKLSIIKSVLQENGVPFLLRDRESGNYMRFLTGFSIYGTDVLVNAEDLSKAKEALDGINFSG